jgi:hypothetical protein
MKGDENMPSGFTTIITSAMSDLSTEFFVFVGLALPTVFILLAFRKGFGTFMRMIRKS